LEFLYQRGKYMEAPRPGLILLDTKLPKVDGIEVLRRIKADPALKSIPVVVLTTSMGEREMMESYNLTRQKSNSSKNWKLGASERSKKLHSCVIWRNQDGKTI